jgi:predicted flap endonuclease-1-like 5' DNA nuclease
VSKVFPFKPREQVVTRIAQRRAAQSVGGSNVVPLQVPARAPRPAARHAEAAPAQMSSQAPLAERLEAVGTERNEASAAAASPGQRYFLSLDSAVVDGPSIGPKTADRLEPLGVKTIRDLMRAEPAALAVMLDSRNVAAGTIADWQDQARLVCTVPGLRGTHAQLLVGAGYRSADALAGAEADKLCADVLTFAACKDGQRALRNGDPPDIEKIKGWLEAARSVKAA